MKKLIACLIIFSFVGSVLMLESCKKKKNDPEETPAPAAEEKGNILVFAKPSYCSDYVGVLTVKVNGETKGTLEHCEADRNCGDSKAITVEVKPGQHSVEVTSSSYNYSGTISVSKDECKKIIIE